MSAITVSFVVWKESWRRAQRCCCTSSARSDNQTSSCIPLGRFGTTTIHDIRGQAWVAPCPACGKAEAAKELREAAILAPLVPFDDGTRLWRAFELGQPERRSTARPHCARVQSTVRLSLARSGMAVAALEVRGAPNAPLLARATLAWAQRPPILHLQ